MINKRYTILFAFALWMIVGIPQMFASNVNQISHINGKGFKIKKPGIYRFTNDIKVDLKNGRAAITIDANNVIIDLNQFTLQQKGSGQNNIGILVKPGHQSITIRNGTIGNIHGFGIQFKEDNHIINLENLTVKSSGSNGSVFLIQDNVPHTGGILFLGTNSLPVTDIILRHVYAVNNRTSNPQARYYQKLWILE